MINRLAFLLALFLGALVLMPAPKLHAQYWASTYDLRLLSDDGHVVSAEDVPPASRAEGPRLYLPGTIYDHDQERSVVLLGEWDPDHEAPSLALGDTLTVIFTGFGPVTPFPAPFVVTAVAAVRPTEVYCLGCPLSGLQGWAYHLALAGTSEDKVLRTAGHESFGGLFPTTALAGPGEVSSPDYEAPDLVVQAVLEAHTARIEDDARELGMTPVDPYPTAVLNWTRQRIEDPELARIIRVRGAEGPLWAVILGAANDPGDKGGATQVLYLVEEDGGLAFQGVVPSSSVLAVGNVTEGDTDELILSRSVVRYDGDQWVVSEPIRAYITH